MPDAIPAALPAEAAKAKASSDVVEFASQMMLVIAALIALIAVLHGISGIIYTSKTGKMPPWRPMILMMAIAGAIMLPAAGFSAEQLTPAYSLLSAVIGFMFGRASAKEGHDEHPGA